MSSRFSPSRELFKVCFGRRLSTPQMQSLGPNKFRQRWKIPASWQWIIHTSGELAVVYHWHWKDKRSVSCWVIKRGVWLAVRYISNQWPGWAGKFNLLMGLMECEMLKEKPPLAVCPLHLATDIATHIEGHSGLISGRSWYPSSLECGKKTCLLESHVAVVRFHQNLSVIYEDFRIPRWGLCVRPLCPVFASHCRFSVFFLAALGGHVTRGKKCWKVILRLSSDGNRFNAIHYRILLKLKCGVCYQTDSERWCQAIVMHSGLTYWLGFLIPRH